TTGRGSTRLRDPLLPDVGAESDRGAAAVAHDGRADQQRIVEQDLLDARSGGRRVLQPALEVALALAIDQLLHAAHARGDPAQLAGRHRFLREVDGLKADAALLEKALALAAVGALLGAE